MNGYIHLSFEPVERFVPRVPRCRQFFEDDQTKRICVGTEILPCLHAVPYGIYILKQMYDALQGTGNHPVLHLYTLWTEEIAYCPSVSEVPDVEKSGERWLLAPPRYVTREDLLVTYLEWEQLPHKPFEEDKFQIPVLRYIKSKEPVDNMTAIIKSWFPENPNTDFIVTYLRDKGYLSTDISDWGYGFETVMKMLDRDGLLHIGLAGLSGTADL